MARLGMIVGVVLGIGLVIGGIALAIVPFHRTPAVVAVSAPAATERPAPTAVPIPTIPPCVSQARTFIDTAQPMAERWDDATKLADSTPRMGLAPQIAAMQTIRREAQALDAPSCAEQAKQFLLAAMDASVNAYIAFLGQQPDTEVQAGFATANQAMNRFQNELAVLTGAPSVKDPLAEQYTAIRAMYQPLGYDLQLAVETSGITTWRGESGGASIVITPNTDGTIKAVRIAGSDLTIIAQTAQIAIPAWTDADKWLAGHQSTNDIFEGVPGAMVSYHHDGGYVTIDLYPDTPKKAL
jgi:hypothetical protein